MIKTQTAPLADLPPSKVGCPPEAKPPKIKDVWMSNFFEELTVLAGLIDQEFTVVAFVSGLH